MKNYGLLLILLLLTTTLLAKPSFNGNASGCSGGGCHSFSSGILTATALDNFQVSIYLPSVNTGEKVAGELVDANGNVVAYNNETHSNPFILAAPGNGNYTVFAGYDEPSRLWDTAEIVFELVGVDPIETLPQKFCLFPNYPNPFNPVTWIRYELPAVQQTRVELFNLSGKLIRTLSNGIQGPGQYQLQWNGRDLSGQPAVSGVYLLRVTAGSESLTRKLILLR